MPFFCLLLSLSVFTSRSTSSFLPSSLSQALSAALSLEAPKGQSPEVSPAKVFLNAATTRVHPHRDNPGLSSGCKSGEYSAYAWFGVRLGARLCAPAAAPSRPLIARLSRCNLLMDQLGGVICIMQK